MLTSPEGSRGACTLGRADHALRRPALGPRRGVPAGPLLLLDRPAAGRGRELP